MKLYPTSMSAVTRAKRPTVSIITRTKNRPVLLARAFASVLSQTFQEWQLIVVNDGGSRSEIELLTRQYERAFAGRLQVVHNERSLGMESSSNVALRRATGDFVIVHDDDDSWRPTFLERTVGFLEQPENHKFVAVASSCVVIREEIVDSRVKKLAEEPWGLSAGPVDATDLVRGNVVPPICLLIRKAAIDVIGEFNESLPVLGDWDFNLRLLAIGDLGTIAESLAYHHRRPHDDGTYANSFVSTHEEFNVLFRNSMVREAINRDPSFLGPLHVILNRLESLETRLIQTQDQKFFEHQQQILETQRRQAVAMQQVESVHRLLLHVLDIVRVLQAQSHANTIALHFWSTIWQWLLPMRAWVARMRRRT
jgi:glycosyltransferase involved in cell wall biosynthesis